MLWEVALMVEMQVSAETYAALRELSEERGVSIPQLFDEIADMAKRMPREELLRKGNEACARPREETST